MNRTQIAPSPSAVKLFVHRVAISCARKPHHPASSSHGRIRGGASTTAAKSRSSGIGRGSRRRRFGTGSSAAGLSGRTPRAWSHR